MDSFASTMQRDFDASFSPITVFRLAITPDDAVSRCVGLWKMKGIRSEKVAMREQFKQRGWSGTELIIGHSGRAFLADLLFGTHAFSLLLPQASSLLPNRVKRAALTKIDVDIVARTIEGESGPITELWCLADWAQRINLSGFESDYLESSMRSLEESFTAQGILSAPVRHLERWDIPSDVPLSYPELTAMRKAAKKCKRKAPFFGRSPLGFPCLVAPEVAQRMIFWRRSASQPNWDRAAAPTQILHEEVAHECG